MSELVPDYPAARSERPCPECHAQCGWCADYIWMVRSIGCCAGWFGGRRPKNRQPCALAINEAGKTCSICGTAKPGAEGGGRVIVESKVVSIVSPVNAGER